MSMALHPPSLAFAVAWMGSAGAMAADDWALGVRKTDPVEPAVQQAAFHVPEGFAVQLVAREPDIHKPMNLAFDALGRLWATTSIEYPFAAPTNRPARDRLMVFEDFGPDGRARKATEFAGGLKDRKSTRLNSSHEWISRMPSSA